MTSSARPAAPPISVTGAVLLRIHVNGEAREVAARTILALVEELALDPRKVAVERNLEIVPRSTYADTPVIDGDQIEIVTFIGGG